MTIHTIEELKNQTVKRAQISSVHQNMCVGLTYSTFVHRSYKTCGKSNYGKKWHPTTYMSQLLVYELHKLLARHAIPEKDDNENEKILNKILTALRIMI